MFSVQHQGFWFENKELRKKHFLVKRGVATKRVFFYEPVFWKMSKVIVFFGHFFGNSWLMFKKHCKNRYFSTFLKAKKMKKKWPFPKLITGPPAKLITGPRLGHLKIGNVAQLLTLQILGSPFLFLKKSAETPIFYSVFRKTIFYKKQTWPSY